MLRLLLKIAYILDVFIEAIIIGKISLSVFAPNQSSSVIQWIDSISNMFISPFSGITATTLVIDSFEISITPIIALLFFAIIGFVLSELLKALKND